MHGRGAAGGFFWFTAIAAGATGALAVCQLPYAFEVVAAGFALHSVALAWALRPGGQLDRDSRARGWLA